MRATEISWLKINWRKELREIDPYLADHGGVVCITGGPSSAPNTFVKLIRQLLDRNMSGNSIQLNPEDENTHTPIDIVRKLEEKLGIQPSIDAQSGPVGDLTVASGIEARDVTISSIEIHYGSGARDTAKELPRRIPVVIDRVGEIITKEKVVVILFNWHKMPAKTVRWFWNEVWSGGLAKFVNQGFLLLCVDETEDGRYHYREPAARPDCLIQLPSRYTDQSRSDALDDMSELLVSQVGIASGEAHAVANSLLIEWEEKPARVHGSLTGHCLKLKSG